MSILSNFSRSVHPNYREQAHKSVNCFCESVHPYKSKIRTYIKKQSLVREPRLCCVITIYLR